jgi:hypothetical protein
MIRRGSAFRAPVSSSFDPFETPLENLGETIPLTEEDRELLNSQRLLVNYLLSPGDDMYMRVPLGAAEGTLSLLTDGTGSKPLPLWKRLSCEIGAEFYPAELMTDSRSVMLGLASRKKTDVAKKRVSLTALEQSEQTGEGDDESPKSNAENIEEEQDDDSIGADDYLVHMDYEDEGARDDAYADEDGGGGDYGGEF